MALTIDFKVNDEIFNLSIDPAELTLYEKLKNDDAYTVQYIKLLIRNGLLCINAGKNKEIQEIYRITGDVEELIYSANMHKLRRTEDQQLAECNKENDASLFESQDCNQKDHWTDSATSFILDKYETYLSQIGPMKKFKTKKVMWSQISADMIKILNISKTALQIENRYKTVLKRKKKAVENNSRSGSSREEVPFEEELRKIAHSDDSIEPKVLRSARNIRYPKLNVPEIPEEICSTSLAKHANDDSPKKKIIKRTSQDVKMELFKEKKAAKERRHQEKLIRELFAKLNTE